MPFPNVKAIHDVPTPTSKPVKNFLGAMFNGYQKSYEKHVGKRLLKGAKTGEGGSAFAGGAFGFAGDYDIEDDYKSPSLATRFAQAFTGAALGYGGIKLVALTRALTIHFLKVNMQKKWV